MPTVAYERSPLVKSTRQQIVRELASGQYALDAALPTHREWAQKLKVSTFVVRLALEELKRQGVVEARKGSYTYLRRIPEGEEMGRLAEGGGPATLELWYSQPRDLRRIHQTAVRHQFQREFRQRHPYVQFQEQNLIVDAGESETEILYQLLAGAGPTVSFLRQSVLRFAVEHALIQPFDAEPIRDYVGRLDPRVAAACRVEGRPGEPEAFYLTPTGGSLSLLIVNRRLAREAGLDEEQPVKDWEGLVQGLRRISRNLGGRPAIWFASWNTAMWWLMQLAHQCLALPARIGDGTRDFARLAALDWRSPALTPAVELFHRVLVTEKLGQVFNGPASLLASHCLADEVAMAVDSSLPGELARVGAAERFTLQPHPVGPSGQTVSLLNFVGWFLNARVQEPTRRAAQQYVADVEAFTHLGAGGPQLLSRGVTPQLFSLFQNPQEDGYCCQSVPPAWRETLGSLLAGAHLEPYESDWRKSVLGDALRDLLGDDQGLGADLIQHHLSLQDATAYPAVVRPPAREIPVPAS